ncbi:MAG: hypothetical protein IJR66_03640 [Clostridia bacterium]|nr:hypothetical protein [Clostridia bacterium]
MDNKINRTRLSNLLAYEWIIIIVCIVALIVGWELIYTTAKADLTFGQTYYIYYDENMYSSNASVLNDNLKNDGVFSYEVQKIVSETYVDGSSSAVDVLSLRIITKEVDMIVTNSIDNSTEQEKAQVRVKSMIDNGAYSVKSIDFMYENAKNYLAVLLKDGETDYHDFNNFDKVKIEERFNTRNKKDNRLRHKLISVDDEYKRIEKLVKDVKTLEKIYEYNDSMSAQNKLFYSYKRYEQSCEFYPENTDYSERLSKEQTDNYGINVSALTVSEEKSAKYNKTDFFKYNGLSDSSDAVIIFTNYIPLSFDFNTSTEYDLEFEKISFITSLVENFSTILD